MIVDPTGVLWRIGQNTHGRACNGFGWFQFFRTTRRSELTARKLPKLLLHFRECGPNCSTMIDRVYLVELQLASNSAVGLSPPKLR